MLADIRGDKIVDLFKKWLLRLLFHSQLWRRILPPNLLSDVTTFQLYRIAGISIFVLFPKRFQFHLSPVEIANCMSTSELGIVTRDAKLSTSHGNTSLLSNVDILDGILDHFWKVPAAKKNVHKSFSVCTATKLTTTDHTNHMRTRGSGQYGQFCEDDRFIAQSRSHRSGASCRSRRAA